MGKKIAVGVTLGMMVLAGTCLVVLVMRSDESPDRNTFVVWLSWAVAALALVCSAWAFRSYRRTGTKGDIYAALGLMTTALVLATDALRMFLFHS
jgi:hypothetical protein